MNDARSVIARFDRENVHGPSQLAGQPKGKAAGIMITHRLKNVCCSGSLALLLAAALVWGCAPEQTQLGDMVPLNLSLIFENQEARRASHIARLAAVVQEWVLGAVPAWAQTVSEIATIEVQVLGPDLPIPRVATVAVANPTSGQVIPVSIDAPVGPDRTIAVAAFNTEGRKVFSGSSRGVHLTAGVPIDLTITLAPTSTITIHKQGSGTGTVTSSPAGIACGDTCSAQFDSTTPVALTAAAAPGSTFSGWTGGGCSGTGGCTVTGTATVTAGFVTAVDTAVLTVIRSGPGTVTSSPSGINCGTACVGSFPSGSSVVLAATPTGGSTFAGWSGACSGTGACLVAMNGNQTVTATFTPPPGTAMLAIAKTGTGAGTVTSSPEGIDCGGTCTASYPSGTFVTLTATPSAGSTFAGWSGGGCSGTGTCVVMMTGSQSVTATFNVSSSMARFIVTKIGTGTGVVISSPQGINCGNNCTAMFPVGTAVTLTAHPTAGSRFVRWHAACQGTGACVVVLTRDQEVTVEFAAR